MTKIAKMGNLKSKAIQRTEAGILILLPWQKIACVSLSAEPPSAISAPLLNLYSSK